MQMRMTICKQYRWTNRKKLQALRLFSHWWLQLKRCQNRCASSVQDNLLKCHVSWYSKVLRDDLKVPFDLNCIHPLFITSASSHSNKGWMLKIGFSKHLCSLKSNTSQKCSKVAGYILSENAVSLLVSHQPINTSAVFVSYSICFPLSLN